MQKKWESVDFQGIFLASLAGGLLVISPLFSKELYASSPPIYWIASNKIESSGEKIALAEPLPAATREAPMRSETPTGLAGSFLAGRFAAQQKDLIEAATQIKKTLAQDPENRQLRHEAMRLCLLAGWMSDAISFAQTMQEDEVDDSLVATLLMLDAVKKNDAVQAKAFIENAPSGGLFGVVRPLILQWLEVASGTSVDKLDLQSTIDRAGFFAPFVTYHSALMNDLLGNVAGARSAYEKASADPDVTPYRVVEAAVNFAQRQSDHTWAESLVRDYAASNPDSTLLPLLSPRSAPMRPMIANAKEGLAELFFTTASILFGENATEDTFLYLRVALELRPDLPPAQMMLGTLYEQMGDYPHAIATYDALDPTSVFYPRAQMRKALNLEAMGKKKAAKALLEKLGEQFPNDPTPSVTRADMLREEGDYANAASAYGIAITRSEPLKPSDWPLLYARGISYEQSGQWPQAEKDFLRALQLEPDQPDVLNYLAYSWLMMNKNIKKARAYLIIAASARPDDAHIMDSLGLSHYLAGDFETSLGLFEKALASMSEDATVNEHVGDAYWRLGRENEARFQWRRARTFLSQEDDLEALDRKIEEGLPPFLPEQAEAASGLEEGGKDLPIPVDAVHDASPSLVIPFKMQAQ